MINVLALVVMLAPQLVFLLLCFAAPAVADVIINGLIVLVSMWQFRRGKKL